MATYNRQRQVQEDLRKLNMKDEDEYVLVAGNPGSGKSTTLNCLMQSKTKEPLRDDQKFQSGVSIGSGMTYQLDTKRLNGVTYMDTPGLDDTKKRKQAAEAITQALKKDGSYRIIFVVTLESGRVRAADVTTMHLILDSAPEISRYGVIFNKLSKPVMQRLTPEATLELLSQVSVKTPGETKEKPLPVPLFLPEKAELHDEDNVVTEIEGLEDWVRCLVPIVIHSNKVEDIPTESFDERKEQYEKQLEFYKNNLEANQRLMEENQKVFKRQYQEMKAESDRRFRQQAEQHERDRKEYQAKVDETQRRNQQEIAAVQARYDRDMQMIKQQSEEEIQRMRKEIEDQKAEAARKERHQREQDENMQREFRQVKAELANSQEFWDKKMEAKKDEIQRLKDDRESELINAHEEEIDNLKAAHAEEIRDINDNLNEVNKGMKFLQEEQARTNYAMQNKKEETGLFSKIVNKIVGGVKMLFGFG